MTYCSRAILETKEVPSQESGEPKDTPQTSRAELSDQHFFIEVYQNAVGDTIKNNDLSTQCFNDTGATCSNSNCDTLTVIEKTQPLVLMLLEKSALAEDGHAMPMKRKVVIQYAFDVEYTCVIERLVHFSDSPEVRMKNRGKDFWQNLMKEFFLETKC